MRQALEKGNQETARIYAENAVRKKSESLNYLRMSGKVDAVASRVKSAQVMKGVSKNMGSVVKSLDKGRWHTIAFGYSMGNYVFACEF